MYRNLKGFLLVRVDVPTLFDFRLYSRTDIANRTQTHMARWKIQRIRSKLHQHRLLLMKKLFRGRRLKLVT